MDSKLHTYEISTYVFLWITGVFYAINQVYITGKLYSHEIVSDDFTDGWYLVGQKKDHSDYEWKTWLEFIWSLTPWIGVHFIVAEIIRYTQLKLLPCWYLLISLTFVTHYLGMAAASFLLSQPSLFYILLQLRSRSAIWIASLALLAALNIDQTTDWLSLPEQQHYLFLVCFAWTHLRCLSFCFDQLQENNESTTKLKDDILTFLSYVLYLPVLFLGPLIMYADFDKGLAMPYNKWTLRRFSILFLNLARFTGWLFFTEFALHYIYCNALQYQPEVVERLSPWALCGLGYCMGQFFMNKYTVVYGLSATIARAEQIEAPAHPKCIARIHLYSDMWKHFDRGLYSFLVKYIYVPCLGVKPAISRRLFSSFICFCFIYIWHRTYLFILVWSILNFIGITVEGIAKNIALTDLYRHLKMKIRPQTLRRLHALIASPLFAMSCISNFYFFGGMEIGNIFARKFTKDMYLNMIVLAFCYCCCQVSIEVKNWEERRKLYQKCSKLHTS